MSRNCSRCDRVFEIFPGLLQHRKAWNYWKGFFGCKKCDRKFDQWAALESHMEALNHFEPPFDCDTCDRTFDSYKACKRHMKTSSHRALNKCTVCDRTFETDEASTHHKNALYHWSDSDDKESSDDTKIFLDDRKYSNSRSQLTVNVNVNDFVTVTGYGSFDMSMGNCNGYFNMSISDHNDFQLHCWDCNQHFHDMTAIRTHLNSAVHRRSDAQNAPCPFCTRSFTALSALAVHLQSSTCANFGQPNPTAVPNGNVTERQLLPEEASGDGTAAIATADMQKSNGQPSHTAAPNGKVSEHQPLQGKASGNKTTATTTTDTQKWKPQLAWCGYGYECYFCNLVFVSPQALENHVGSETHQLLLYYCPNGDKCGRQFPSLGALFSHLESEACGYRRFVLSQKEAQTDVSDAIDWGEQYLPEYV